MIIILIESWLDDIRGQTLSLSNNIKDRLEKKIYLKYLDECTY